MAPDSLSSVRKLLHPYYLTNILLALSFLICRMTRPVCDWAFDDCELSYVSLLSPQSQDPNVCL